jgi:hypothetical protein
MISGERLAKLLFRESVRRKVRRLKGKFAEMLRNAKKFEGSA